MVARFFTPPPLITRDSFASTVFPFVSSLLLPPSRSFLPSLLAFPHTRVFLRLPKFKFATETVTERRAVTTNGRPRVAGRGERAFVRAFIRPSAMADAGDDDAARFRWRPAVVGARDHEASVKSIDVTRRDDGAVVVTTASADGNILVRPFVDPRVEDEGRRAREDERGETRGARLRGHRDVARAAKRRGDRVLSASYDRTARVWTLPSSSSSSSNAREAMVTLRGHTDYVADCAWCGAAESFGETAATASSDGTVRLWRTETGECLQVVDVRENSDTGAVTCVDAMTTTDAPGTVSDECVFVVGLMDGSTRFYHARTGACALVLLGHLGAVTGIAVSTDEIASSSSARDARARVCYGCRDGSVGCFDAHSRDDGLTMEIAHIARRSGHPDADLEGVTCVRFVSSTTRAIATSSEDGTARVWNPQRGACDFLLTGQTPSASIDCVSMLDDVLACGGSDGTVSVWTRETARGDTDDENEEDDASTLAARADVALRWLLRRGPQVRVDGVDGVEDDALLCAAFDAADREARALLTVQPSNDEAIDVQCGVCGDALLRADAELAQLPCAHVFHTDCLLPWMLVSHQCPLCREINYESGVSHALACVRVSRRRRSVSRWKKASSSSPAAGARDALLDASREHARGARG